MPLGCKREFGRGLATGDYQLNPDPPVPKMLGFLRTEWCPDAYIISFKLETDKNILKDKVLKSMGNYKQNLVIGNLLASYKVSFLFVPVSLSKFYVLQETKRLIWFE